MKTLPPVTPTAEQLPLISDGILGVEVIRGAAGSGKTSTAILRLQSLTYLLEARREREGSSVPVRILVLTFNRTLSGYVSALVNEQVDSIANTQVTVDTFGHWAMEHCGYPKVVSDRDREATIQALAASIPTLSAAFLTREVEYLLGRFEPTDLEAYVSAERTGRGAEPRVDRALRRRILDQIVYPYRAWLVERGEIDWNDVALRMATEAQHLEYDIVIVDESQDFSANQLRAVRAHISDEHAVTFVIDAVQRIYARGFTWAETGFDMRGARYHRLRENHRNTREIAAFAAGLLAGVAADPDGSLPDLSAASRSGPRPRVIRGLYTNQVAWALKYIDENVNLQEETVAFLKPQGGGAFSSRSAVNWMPDDINTRI